MSLLARSFHWIGHWLYLKTSTHIFHLQIHLFAEPFCVVLYRQLSSKHPLHELLKYHCRGVIATNTIGSPSLITPHQYMDKLTAMGHIGTVLLLDRGYKTLSWKDTDFHLDIKVNKSVSLWSKYFLQTLIISLVRLDLPNRHEPWFTIIITCSIMNWTLLSIL